MGTLRLLRVVGLPGLLLALGCSGRSTLVDTVPDGGTGDGGSGDGDGDGDGAGDGDGDGTGSGDPSQPGDPCFGLPNACFTVGLSCQGTDLVDCQENDDGCLVAERESCVGGDTNTCDPSGPECVFDPCLNLPDACEVAGLSCEGTNLVDCAENDDGCLVASETDCTDDGDNNFCDAEASGGPACAYDECRTDDGERKDSVCVVDELSCQGPILVACTDDADGCPIASRTDCTMEAGTNSCDDSGTPQCVDDPCLGVTDCVTAGSSCRGVELVVCEANGDGCLVEAVTDCTVGGTVAETCDDSSTPACVACTDDAACSAASEGDTSCDGNVLETCTDADGDSCLELVPTDCGDDFTCDADDGCVYSGGDSCTEELAPGNVLSGAFTTGQYDTGAEGVANDYGGYTCPQLTSGLPFFAGAPDILFAVDVPPASVVTVTLVGAEGFTGSGAWMLQLPVCADGDGGGAEALCSDIDATALRFSNETDATQRSYLVVDADGGTNVGTFALEVDTRPLGCGDGRVDGTEECDDGNPFDDDGCTPECTLEEGFECTANDPSVCTRRPDDAVCGNVLCPDLPEGAPGGSEVCCTPDELCGVALSSYYGAGCLLRDQEGVPDEACPSQEGVFTLLPTLAGCCRPDDKCGIQSSTGAGCIERTEAWLNHQDSSAFGFYPGPWEEVGCDFPD